MPVKQLGEDFARYFYSPRLLEAVRDGCALITWERESFAYADSYAESTGRDRGLRGGQHVRVSTEIGRAHV